MATITDVARMAGVSRSTVSRVLNNQAYIKAETRSRVEEAIHNLHYRPNSLARSLVKQRTGNILVLGRNTLSDAYYSILAEAIMDRANDHGYNTLFFVNSHDDGVPLRFLDSLYGNVDGMVFLAAFRILDRDSLLYLKKLELPMVLINSNFAVPGVAEINIDNYSGSYLATEKLIALGHTRIGYVAAMVKDNFEMRTRLDAFYQAMWDHHLTVDENLVIHAGSPAYTSGYEIAPEILARDPTALLCTNDMLAHGIYRWADEQGMRVPEDISIVGFDDILSQIDPERMVARELSTVRQPLRDMADYAVDTLHTIIETGETFGNRIFPVSWTDFGTTAPVKSRSGVAGDG